MRLRNITQIFMDLSLRQPQRNKLYCKSQDFFFLFNTNIINNFYNHNLYIFKKVLVDSRDCGIRAYVLSSF